MTKEDTAEPTFSAQEAAVYDRQMRLWGVEAQKRLLQAHVLVCGLSALGSELVKNVALAGMNVTVQDDGAVTQDDAATQFFFMDEDVGQSRATVCVRKVQDLNPLVKVHGETHALEALPDTFVDGFTVVCVVGASQATELRIDALCRARGIAFFAAQSFGLEGIFFADLASHTFRRSPVGENAAPADPITIEFPSMEQALRVQWSSLQSTRKRGPQMPRVFVKHQLLQQYAGKASGDASAFVAFAQTQLEKQGLTRDFFSEAELQDLVRVADAQIVPVCAIIAGMLGQEIVKAISCKDEPICNYFCFDGAAGTVRRIA